MTTDDCPVCLSYSADTLRQIDRAGRAHDYAMTAIRSVEQNGVGRAVAMSPTINTSALLEQEAEETAVALNL